MYRFLPSDAPLSAHARSWAESEREDAKGYRDMRNILGVGFVGITLASNASESINSLPPIDQLKFNAAGLVLAGISALGMERGRRKLERKARIWDAHAEELSSLEI